MNSCELLQVAFQLRTAPPPVQQTTLSISLPCHDTPPPTTCACSLCQHRPAASAPRWQRAVLCTPVSLSLSPQLRRPCPASTQHTPNPPCKPICVHINSQLLCLEFTTACRSLRPQPAPHLSAFPSFPFISPPASLEAPPVLPLSPLLLQLRCPRVLTQPTGTRQDGGRVNAGTWPHTGQRKCKRGS